MSLDKIVRATTESITANMGCKLQKIIARKEFMGMADLSPDEIFDIIFKFYESKSDEYIIDKIPTKYLENLKETVLTYSLYYAMDYVNLLQNPDGIELNMRFIKDFYQCEETEASEIWDRIKRQKGKFPDMIGYPVSNYPNPYTVYKYEKEMKEKNNKKKYSAHIYNNNLLAYLKKNVQYKNKKIIIKTISPSIIMASLRSKGFLPNSEYVNRQKDSISVNTIMKIENTLTDVLAYTHDKDENLIDYIAFRKDHLTYETSKDIAERINYVLVDDLFRLRRLNSALSCYNECIENIEEENQKKDHEYICASICSLLMEVPQSLLYHYEPEVKSAIDSYWKNEPFKVKKSIQRILTFSSFLFPFTVGMFCTLLFYDQFANNFEGKDMIEAIQGKIKELENAIFKMREEKKLSDTKKNWDTLTGNKHIWYNSEIVQIKTKPKRDNASHTYVQWAKDDKHKIELSEMIGIMLNQSSNTFKSRQFIETNSQIYNDNICLYPYLNRILYEPFEYVDTLTDAFSNGIYDYLVRTGTLERVQEENTEKNTTN